MKNDLSSRQANSPCLSHPLQSMPRREFLQSIGAISTSVALPAGAFAGLRKLSRPVRIGMIADLHQDVMHDGEARIQAFLEAMADVAPDALLQLGDFACPKAGNRAVIEAFNQAHKNTLHVIGNHDTDNGHTRQQCLDMWGMRGRFYGQDIAGLRLLVLDGNDRGSPTYSGGYPSFIGQEQVEWLKEQLGAHDGPIIVVSHQPLAGVAAVDNAGELQKLLGQHADKVVLAVNGHSHVDQFLRIGNVPYLHINSASYQWVGGSHKHNSYAEEIHDAYPWISHTCPYRDALFATLTLDPEDGMIHIQGRQSAWVGPSPSELGITMDPQTTHGEEVVVPAIRPRRIRHAV